MNAPFSANEFWIGITLLGALTFLARFSFIGLMRGQRQPPEWLRRVLRFVPVTVLPALIAPMVLLPKATGGQTDSARIIAALLALAVGARTKNMLFAILSGMGGFWLIQLFS